MQLPAVLFVSVMPVAEGSAHSPRFPEVAQEPLVTPEIVGVLSVPLFCNTTEPVPVVEVTVTAPLEKMGTPVAELLFAPNPPEAVFSGVVRPVSEVMLELAPEFAMPSVERV